MMATKIDTLIKDVKKDISGKWISVEDLHSFAQNIVLECAKTQSQRSCERHGYDKHGDSEAIIESSGIFDK